MRKFIILITITLLFIPISASAVLVGKNILPNGSFENRPGGGNEDPRNWGSWNSDYNGIATNESRRGSQSIYLRCPKTDDVEGIFYSYKKVKPGREYTFSCYAKNSLKDPVKGNAFGQISIEWYKKGKDKDGKDASIEISRSWGPTFGPELHIIKWMPFTMTVTAPTDADQCSFVIQFFNRGEGSGELFVDDAEAEEIDPYFKIKRKDFRAKDKDRDLETRAAEYNVTANNLLPNASFEEPQGSAEGDLTDWVCWNSDYNGISTEKMRTGNQCFYISSAPQPESHSGIFYEYNGVKQDKEYVFSCYVMNSAKNPITGGAYGQLSIEWRRGDQEITRAWGPVFGPELSTSRWEAETMTASPPADADNCKFVIQFFGKDGRGAFYADDVSAEER